MHLQLHVHSTHLFANLNLSAKFNDSYEEKSKFIYVLYVDVCLCVYVIRTLSTGKHLATTIGT